jgi:serine/threonine-protein kinase
MNAENEVRARAAARIGHVLRGKYRVDSVLGVGGMAVVYAATHRNKKRFAIKILHPELSTRSDIRQRFLREGYAANSLDHPGAVAILDDDIAEDGAAFLVMELLEGASVEALWEVSGHRLPVAVVLAIAHELLELLAMAHEKAVVHRDIKPANLFVTRDGVVKVLDFGIARVKDVTSEGSSTNTGTMLGTPAFMPPEQAGGLTSEIDSRTDLWGAAATMFTLLSGEFVHRGETPTQMAIQAATKPARSLASVLPDAPAPLVALIDRALAFEKASRWQSARAMSDAVEQVHRELFDAPVSREALVKALAEFTKRSGHLKATAATISAGGSDAEFAPTMPQQNTPAFTPPFTPPFPPLSPLAESTQKPASATTGGQVSEHRPSRGPEGPRPSLSVVGIALVAVVALAGGGFALLSRGPRSQPAPAAATSAAPAATPTSAPTKSFALAVSPADATVEVDGKQTPVTEGAVPVSGAPGSMHLLHVTSGGRDATYPVLLTDTGVVPPRIELVSSPASTSTASSPPPRRVERPTGAPTGTPSPAPAQTGAASPSATASQNSVSRTME